MQFNTLNEKYEKLCNKMADMHLKLSQTQVEKFNLENSNQTLEQEILFLKNQSNDLNKTQIIEPSRCDMD